MEPGGTRILQKVRSYNGTIGTHGTLFEQLGTQAPRWAPLARREVNGTGLFYWQPNAPRRPCNVIGRGKHVRPIPPMQLREDLGYLLNAEGHTHGIEVGVQRGHFAESLLRRWTSCVHYLLVDLWGKQENYADSAGSADQEAAFRETRRRMAAFPHANPTPCRDFSTNCARVVQNNSVDFIYLDARHDYWGVLQDIESYWSKLKPGGIMAGHDFVVASEHDQWQGPSNEGGNPNADYSLNGDGTRDPWGRAVRGAVDDFFTHCVPRQVTVTYRDGNSLRGRFNPVYSTWIVRK